MDEKLKVFWRKLNSDAKDLWEKNKLFFVVFGIIIVTIKFKDVLLDLLISSSKQIETSAKKKDSALAAQESTDSTKADALVQAAKDLPAQEKPVDENWYKND